MLHNQKTMTKTDIDAVLHYLPIFEAEGFQYGEWRGGCRDGEIGPGKTTTMAWCSFSEESSAFCKVLYEHGWVYDFNWMAWEREARRYEESPEEVAAADLDTIRKLLTTHVRADRFCEGHLMSIFKSGHLVAVLRRLKDLREAVM